MVIADSNNMVSLVVNLVNTDYTFLVGDKLLVEVKKVPVLAFIEANYSGTNAFHTEEGFDFLSE